MSAYRKLIRRFIPKDMLEDVALEHCRENGVVFVKPDAHADFTVVAYRDIRCDIGGDQPAVNLHPRDQLTVYIPPNKRAAGSNVWITAPH